MDVSPHWYALAVVTTLLNGFTFGFIARRESNRVLKRWAWAWLSWGLAAASLTALGSPEERPLLAVVCGLLWVLSALCFLAGAYDFAERPMPRVWYAVGAACALLGIGIGVGPNGAQGMGPLVLFQSVGLGATGALLLRRARHRAGAWISGAALVALGVHLLDAPLLVTRPALFLWGFALAIALQVLAALGMLMLHYEHARQALLETQRVSEEQRRMEALGRIAGGVAHDFNNMLAVMLGELELARMEPPTHEGLEETLSAIEEAVQRAARLTAQLLAFGRQSVLRPHTTDIRAVVESTLDLLKKVVPENIQLKFECGEGPFTASMDQALLEQIALNLVTNARDAISGQGHIVVALSRSAQPEETVHLRVTDDGIGMDAGMMQRIFEPFYTSKGTGRGTGLGLASVQGAVTQLGGSIRVHSQPGRGSSFEVVLPWVAPRAREELRAAPHAVGTARILVVDDDEGVRRLTLEMLKRAGHKAEQACDGAAALELLQRNRYDLVISDVVMPHMGGLELFAHVEKLHPETKLLLTSGYPFQSEKPIAYPLLAKPFRRVDLLDAVARQVTPLRARNMRSHAATG